MNYRAYPHYFDQFSMIMCRDMDLEIEVETYIQNQITYITTTIDKQKNRKHKLKIFMYTLVGLSCVFSAVIPVIELFRSISPLSIMSSCFAVCNTISVSFLAKFNLAKKIEICTQNLIKLDYNKRKLEKMYTFDLQNYSDVEKKMSKIIENISQLQL